MADYLAGMLSPSPANPGYGYLTWINSDDYYSGSYPERIHVEHRIAPGCPNYLYKFNGIGGQIFYIAASRDLVIVREGDADPAPAGFSFFDQAVDVSEFAHRAVTDVPPEPYASPYDHPVDFGPLGRRRTRRVDLVQPRADRKNRRSPDHSGETAGAWPREKRAKNSTPE